VSNRQLSLTVKACEVLDTIPKRSRSKFVSDAIINYGQKKGILDNYIIEKPAKRKDKIEVKTQNIIKKVNTETRNTHSDIVEDNAENIISKKKKVKIDSGY
jgi:hypothetical protein